MEVIGSKMKRGQLILKDTHGNLYIAFRIPTRAGKYRPTESHHRAQKKWRDNKDNREHFNKWRKNWRKNLPFEQWQHYREQKREYMKGYYQKNRHHILDYHKEYYRKKRREQLVNSSSKNDTKSIKSRRKMTRK